MNRDKITFEEWMNEVKEIDKLCGLPSDKYTEKKWNELYDRFFSPAEAYGLFHRFEAADAESEISPILITAEAVEVTHEMVTRLYRNANMELMAG